MSHYITREKKSSPRFTHPMKRNPGMYTGSWDHLHNPAPLLCNTFSWHGTAVFLLNWSIQLFTTHTKTARVYLWPINVTILSDGRQLWISAPLILISCLHLDSVLHAWFTGGTINEFSYNRYWKIKTQARQRNKTICFNTTEAFHSFMGFIAHGMKS